MNNDIISKVFRYLGLGLFITFTTAYLTSTSINMLRFIFGSGGYIIIVILQIVCTLWLSIRIRNMSTSSALMLYLGYTALTGLTFSSIFIMFEISSVIFIFLATSVIFFIFSFVGKSLNVDMHKLGFYLLIALLSIIALELINMFLLNNTLNMILCILTIMVFVFYIAYDIKKIEYYDSDNMAIYGAFSLYLDFINIFIRLLELFGKRRD